MYFEDTMPFATSDQHYFHSNVIQYCNRPFKNEGEMRKILIERHNEVVGKDDHIFIIGDLSMVGTSQHEKVTDLLKKLNGHKHLIMGSHDEIKALRYVDVGFVAAHTSLEIDVRWNGGTRHFTLCHDPFEKDIPLGINYETRILLCGHVHNYFKILPDKNTVNVGVDMWNFYPISFKKAWNTLEEWKIADKKRFGDSVIRPEQEVS